MKINFDEIKIKVKITEGKIKAIVSLDFGDFIVKGFRIQESQYENTRGQKLWLTPPAYLGGGRYHPIFFMPDKSLWEGLQTKIWDEYYKQINQHFKKRMNVDDDDGTFVITKEDLPP